MSTDFIVGSASELKTINTKRIRVRFSAHRASKEHNLPEEQQGPFATRLQR